MPRTVMYGASKTLKLPRMCRWMEKMNFHTPGVVSHIAYHIEEEGAARKGPTIPRTKRLGAVLWR